MLCLSAHVTDGTITAVTATPVVSQYNLSLFPYIFRFGATVDNVFHNFYNWSLSPHYCEYFENVDSFYKTDAIFMID